MSDKDVNRKRRRFLISATSVVGAAGVCALAWPFLDSLSPSARAKSLGAPVRADISKIEEGQQVTFFWRSQPVWALNRSKKMRESLSEWGSRLSDPKCEQAQQPAYCKNEYRSIKPRWLIMIGICTHLGCVPDLKEKAPDPAVDADWHGGYLCPCHGSKYDLSGRVLRGQPAPLNMVVPPYHYVTDTLVEIGVNPGEKKT